MANLEGWHTDPNNHKQFRYHDGNGFTERTTTEVGEVTIPFGLFGKRFFSLKAELMPLLVGIVAVLGWLFWYLAGVAFGGIGLWLGISFLRIGRTGLLIAGTVLSAFGLLLSGVFWVLTIILTFL
jgi:hypothetical protein